MVSRKKDFMKFENSPEQFNPKQDTQVGNQTLLPTNSEYRNCFKQTTEKNTEPSVIDFGQTDIYKAHTREHRTEVIAWNKKTKSADGHLPQHARADAQKDHHWKVPGKDDHYSGWKPGDEFNPKDFEKFRDSVRSYVAEFMKLNHIDKNSAAGEAFRNAFQHELASAALQKQTKTPVWIVDAIGVGQEIYQSGKDILGIYGGASMIEAGGRIGNDQLVKDGKNALRENSDRLATMFPSDTINDIANNHKGAELAQGTSSWEALLKKVADSASKAQTNNGVGQ